MLLFSGNHREKSWANFLQDISAVDGLSLMEHKSSFIKSQDISKIIPVFGILRIPKEEQRVDYR